MAGDGLADGSRIFISYSRKDSAHAERLVAALLLNGVSVWYDEFDISVGENIYEKVEKGIISVDFFGVILTGNSLGSQWVREEMSLAKQREMEERRIVILPLVFEDVRLPLHLRKKRCADFTNFDKGLQELMRTFGRRVSTTPLDTAVRERVRSALTAAAERDAAGVGRALRTQSAARVAREFAMFPEKADSVLRSHPEVTGSKRVYVDIQSANAVIPMAMDPEEPSGHLLARLLRALGLDEVVSGQRMAFFLLHDDIPLEAAETLAEAGVAEGDHLRLGLYTFLIE